LIFFLLLEYPSPENKSHFIVKQFLNPLFLYKQGPSTVRCLYINLCQVVGQPVTPELLSQIFVFN